VNLVTSAQNLSKRVSSMSFGAPVTHVYNPLEYAWAAHKKYLERYARTSCEVIFLGMNPGPWGMAQTGIPFGEVAAAREFLDVAAPVGKPSLEHPKRPVLGFDSPRSEVSGRRVWGWAKAHFASADHFFDRFFIVNYCPLSFMEASGKNRTPDKLPGTERQPLFEACNEALRAVVETLSPAWVVGVGAFAEKKAAEVVGDMDVKIGRILHPSPASPLANRGWAAQANSQLAELGIQIPGQ
jgi:single-strand selective monofunctional uracil DNA glycosylase